MSRINTNVSSLIAQNTLTRSNADLNQSLVRLSTGLRINSGADDPAGLIASEALRRDITAVNRAISNSERAGQLISTADSALGQVSNLLIDIRGLISEAAIDRGGNLLKVLKTRLFPMAIQSRPMTQHHCRFACKDQLHHASGRGVVI